MKASTWVLIAFAILGMIGIATWRLAGDTIKEQLTEDTSEAKDMKGTITIALDSFQGYFHLRSAVFKKMMAQQKYRVKVVDDSANYPERMEKLSKGEYDMAVVTVDSDLLNAAMYDFPGVIVLVIDESKGADAVVGLKDKGQNLKDFLGKNVRVAFTPNSPSHHLLKAVKSHFGINELLPDEGSPLRIETNGSTEALKKLLTGETDVAVLWEPDVSKALKDPKFVKVFSTAETEGYIVDILVVNRKFFAKEPALVKRVMATYFRGLKYYADHRDELIAEMKKEADLDEADVKKVLEGIKWYNLSANARQWFGVARPGEDAEERIVASIESTVKVLVSNKDFSESPLPKGDPYAIFNADVIEDLLKNGVNDFSAQGGAEDDSVDKPVALKFDALPPERWEQLAVVGNLKVENIVFQSGTAVMGFDGKLELDELAKKLASYPTYRMKVIGHTGTEGEPEANRALSLERSKAVIQYLTVVHNVDPNRCLALGKGGDEPLLREPDETDKHWQMRLKRVEIVLVKDEY